MPLPVPNLDNKLFAELVNESRALIPLATPTWTDHNLHDPGITFIELFSWLTELELYRANRISGAAREAHAAMVCIRRAEAIPARTTIQLNTTADLTFVPAGTSIRPRHVPDIWFETVADAFVSNAEIAKIVRQCGDQQDDLTAANKDTPTTYHPFGLAAPIGATLEITISPNVPAPAAHIHLELQPFADFEGQTSARLAWETDGDGSWQPLEILADETNHCSRSGAVRFVVTPSMAQQPELRLRVRLAAEHFEVAPLIRRISLHTLAARQVRMIKGEVLGLGGGGPDQCFELKSKNLLDEHPATWRQWPSAEDIRDGTRLIEELRVSAQAAESPDGIIEAFSTAIPAESLTWSNDVLSGYELAQTIRAALNSSSAHQATQDLHAQPHSSDQQLQALKLTRIFWHFRKALEPVALEIETQTPSGKLRRWHQTDSLTEAKPGERVFVFDRGSNQVRFGNGLNGAVPGEGVLVRATYRTCEGCAGNVAGDEPWEFNSSDLKHLRGVNAQPAMGGRPREDLTTMERNMRRRLRTPARTITRADYVALTLATPQRPIARATAIVNRNPRFPGCERPGELIVAVLSFADPQVPRRSESQALLDVVRSHLEPRRILGDILHVVGASIVKVDIRARVHHEQNASATRVREACEQALRARIAPLTHRDPADGWPFGRDVHAGDVLATLNAVPGVAFADALSFWVGGNQVASVTLPPEALPELQHIELQTHAYDPRQEKRRMA